MKFFFNLFILENKLIHLKLTLMDGITDTYNDDRYKDHHNTPDNGTHGFRGYTFPFLEIKSPKIRGNNNGRHV
jgi:hypothetical protein